MELLTKVKRFIISSHRNVNQYYDESTFGCEIPYHFHLQAVVNNGKRFLGLVKIDPKKYNLTSEVDLLFVLEIAFWGHDLLEDTRLTYNDLIKELIHLGVKKELAEMATEIIFLVTDFRGRNKGERKPEGFYDELKTNELAILVKLSDMAANMGYGKLFCTKQLDGYRTNDLPKIKKLCYVGEFEPIYDYLSLI